MSGRTYIFAGGGTGGHLFPGIAVAERLIEREPGARILFVGSGRPIEREILAATPFEHHVLPAASLAELKRHPLRFGSTAAQGYGASLALLRELAPTAVIGCGGFASFFPVLAARRRRIPFLLLEQNAIPGRATRWLSRFGGVTCLTYASAADWLPRSARCVVTGNPVRRNIAELAQIRDRRSEDRHTLLVLGGSQGARRLNDLMMAFVANHPEPFSLWQIVHQTGPSDVERVSSHYEAYKRVATVSAFFPDASKRYQCADVVVSRAGGTTLAELGCAGLPAILVPYPAAADDHQRHNAEFYVAGGAAVVVDERTAPSSQFGEHLLALLENCRMRAEMSAAMQALARPRAAADVADQLEQLVDSQACPIDSHENSRECIKKTN